MATIIFAFLAILALIALRLIFNTLKQILHELKNIKIPEPQKVEFPKIEIPQAKEYSLDLSSVIEAIQGIHIPEPQKIEIPQAKETNINVDILQEAVTLMRVNQAEFQSGLEAFHKAVDKLLAQIPSGEKELDAQREFMQKFEDAMRISQENSAEAMNENSLRLQEILAEFLSKEQKNG